MRCIEVDDALERSGFEVIDDPADDGHFLIHKGGRKVGDYVFRWKVQTGALLSHFEVNGRVRDWWPNVETQEAYRFRVVDLIERFRR